MLNKKITTFFFLLVFAITSLQAQEMPVPLSLQFSLFLKIMTYDRNFHERVGDEIMIGVVYQSRFRKSQQARQELAAIIKQAASDSIEEIPFKIVPVDLDKTSLSAAVAKNNFDLLYVLPLRAVSIKSITRVSRKHKLRTFTGVQKYVESGLSAGVGLKNGSPEILINLNAAKTEGADFSSELLNLAKIYK